jgi:hypothetical protein
LTTIVILFSSSARLRNPVRASDRTILPRRQQQLAVSAFADLQIGSSRGRTQRLLDQSRTCLEVSLHAASKKQLSFAQTVAPSSRVELGSP